ncbi:MAG: hypothetical protein ABIT83_08220 [Massilia sp.]
MFTMILLVYLQSGLTVNLIGATVSGEFADLRACRAASTRAIHTLPIPQGYDAAWQDATCTPINRNVKVGNERLTAMDRALFAALEPQPCAAPAACRPADPVRHPPASRKRKSSGKIGDNGR